VLRVLAHREYERDMFRSWDQALEVCQNSPAQIRGYLRGLRDGNRRRGRGRPKLVRSTKKHAITDYRIGRCFHGIRLHRVR